MEPTLQLLACGLVLLLAGDSAASAPRNLQLLGAASDILADLASAAVSGLQELVAAAGEAARTAVSALVARTERYLAQLRHEPLNITRVVTSSSGLVKVVRLLVEVGADYNRQDDYSLTPLHHAAMRGYSKVRVGHCGGQRIV